MAKFKEEIMKELYDQGELFNSAFNDPATLEQALSLIVNAVDNLMDEARADLNDPRPKTQEVAKKTLELADRAIEAESLARVIKEMNKKNSILGVSPIAMG